jgi:hypothetical protein
MTVNDEMTRIDIKNIGFRIDMPRSNDRNLRALIIMGYNYQNWKKGNNFESPVKRPSVR